MSKKLYLYEYIDRLTTHYHRGGGLVIITEGDPSEAWRERNARIAAEHPSNGVFLDPEEVVQELPVPDRVIEVAGSEPDGVFVFQDAGCC